MSDPLLMQADDVALFLSLRPRFAELILDGEKTVELRRVRPTASRGTPVLLYASSPSMALVGQAEVGNIHVDGLDRIWKKFGADTGIDRTEFDDYFSGLDQAVAITLVNIQPLAMPRSLADMRYRLSGFRPPQSYRYLNPRQVAALV